MFFFWVLGLFVVVGAPALSIWAIVTARENRARMDRLQWEVAALREQLGEPPETPAPPVETPTPEPEAAAPPVEEDSPAPEAVPEPPEPPTQEPIPPIAAAAPAEGLEQRLTARWLVWLGGITLALGGGFLVKYAIDLGLLGPAARCALGALIGMALIGGGEWLRRQPLTKSLAAIAPSQIPPTLTAAGITILYASIYAAFALYALLPPLLAFVLLALVSAGAVALSLIHGPVIAILGVLGGYLVPLLVSTDSHSPVALFSYLLVLAAATLAIVRYRGWWRIAWLSLAGGTLWPVLWFLTSWYGSDTPIMAIYLLVLAGMFLAFESVVSDTVEGPPIWGLFPRLTVAKQIVWTAGLSIAGLIFVLVRVDGYDPASLIALGLLTVMFGVRARTDSDFDLLPFATLIVTLGLFATWHLPGIMNEYGYVAGATGFRYELGRGPVVPPVLMPFATITGLFALLYGAGGFFALWGAKRPGVWAALSVSGTVLILAIDYWRFQTTGVDLAWAMIGLGLAGLSAFAAERIARRREDTATLDAALGAFAIGVIAALCLAATMAFEQAWLTVALAVQLPAMAWVHGRLNLPALRWLAGIVACIVLIRLVFNHNILDYPLGATPGLSWMLYGYGVPAAAFYIAAGWFRRDRDDWLVSLLESGAIVFGVLLISLEIRHVISGSLTGDYELLEQGLQTIAWTLLGAAFYRVAAGGGRFAVRWAWRVLWSLALGQFVLLQLLAVNPLFERVPVGDMPVLNTLLLAYLAPGALAGYVALTVARDGRRRMALTAGTTALVAVFAWLSLEVRHGFHGSILYGGEPTDGEWYAYSAAWLAYGLALLGLAIRFNHAALRYASLTVVMLTVAKVFVFDMSALEGLYRAASFLGLGLALVGIGWLYQRFVFPAPAAPATAK